MDDEEIVADIAQQMLEYLGYETIVVQAGEEAVESYQKAYETGRPYVLAILDLNIPQGMGGIEAGKKILEFDRKARVVVSSGYSDAPIMRDFQNYGFVAAISKPFDIQGLKAVVEKAVA